MININIVRDKECFVQEFTVKGHADSVRSGRDIVCAAVSAITYTALGALDELTGIRHYTEEYGYIRCNMPLDVFGDNKYRAQIILDAMVIGFKQVELQYKKYVSVMDEEV